ncbi:MAG: hypothetical protein HYR75_02465 [Gemmatimonadetes bacterium]|nr:hypothetical protein [Gemmatimonadota bacterium]
MTGPGYDLHQLWGTAGVSQRVEWQLPAGAIPLSLGRFGSLAMPVTVAPYAQAIWVAGGGAGSAAYGSLGVAVLTVFDLVRLDVARGLRGGRWSFGFDLTRDYWRIF